jgi:hypothetical protein
MADQYRLRPMSRIQVPLWCSRMTS